MLRHIVSFECIKHDKIVFFAADRRALYEYAAIANEVFRIRSGNIVEISIRNPFHCRIDFDGMNRGIGEHFLQRLRQSTTT